MLFFIKPQTGQVKSIIGKTKSVILKNKKCDFLNLPIIESDVYTFLFEFKFLAFHFLF